MSIDVTPGRTDASLSLRVADEIRVLLTRRRMSQAELARRLEVSGPWLNYRLTGKQPIDLNDLAIIATALSSTPVDILSRALATGESPAKRAERRTSRHDIPAASRPKVTGRPSSYPTNRRRPELIGYR